MKQDEDQSHVSSEIQLRFDIDFYLFFISDIANTGYTAPRPRGLFFGYGSPGYTKMMRHAKTFFVASLWMRTEVDPCIFADIGLTQITDYIIIFRGSIISSYTFKPKWRHPLRRRARPAKKWQWSGCARSFIF